MLLYRIILTFVGICCNGVSCEVYTNMWSAIVSTYNYSNRHLISWYQTNCCVFDCMYMWIHT